AARFGSADGAKRAGGVFSTQRGVDARGRLLPASSRTGVNEKPESPGISLWTVWTSSPERGTEPTRTSREDAERAELRPPPAAQLVARDVREIVERLADRLPEEPCGLVVVDVGAARGLGDDRVDHAELEAVLGVGLEGRGGLLRLGGVAPEDHRAALRRDHGVDRVLLHQDPVGERDRDRPAGAALADHACD